ncbi:MAG: MaoC family dehydratase [Chromatiales bacterium]|jgi:acyl dehydratase|nr:MaoC family dehydratase [Chromatiales bacterium]
MSGLYFDEFEVGKVYKHAVTRTITEADNVLFTCLTMNTQPLHLDEDFAKTTQHGQRIVNSIFTLGTMVGITVTETTLGTTLGNLSMTNIRFPAPVFHGDTIRVETEVTGKKESTSKPDRGVVFFTHRAFNQRGEEVAYCERAGMMMRKQAD